MAKPRKPGTARTTRAKAGAKLKSTADDPAKVEDAEIVEEGAAGGSDASRETPQAVGSPDAGAEKVETGDDAKPAADAAEQEAASAKTEVADVKDETATAETRPDAPLDGTTSAPGSPPLGDEALIGAEDRTNASVEPVPEGESRDVLPIPPAPLEPPRRGGFMPLFLGGVLAAILGAGALYLSHEQGWIDLDAANRADLEARLAAQDARAVELRDAVTAAQDDIAALREAAPDLGPLTEKAQTLGETVTGLNARQAELAARLDATDARLAEVETQPIPKAELPAEVVAAYEAKLGELQVALDRRTAEMQAALDERSAEMQAQLDEKLAEVSAAQSAAADAERLALETARNAEARAALAEIDAALDAGTGYVEALDRLSAASDAAIPQMLTETAASGVPSLSQLQASFADAARAALKASTRAARDAGAVDPVSAFFRTQLGARSLEPREGDDPDAVLSRAENAVNRGDLSAALAEIETLPEAGRSTLADWASRAETHIAARTAVADLAQQLNSN